MHAEQLVREGRLDEALAALQDAVRDDPSSPKLRVFLFQLLAVRGEWSRAMTQLEVAQQLDTGAAMMARVCGQAIRCELLRAAVFRGERTPLIFGEPAPWMGRLVQACQLLGRGEPARAAEARDTAFDEAPAVAGTIDGRPFEWLADADTRLGPVAEAIIEGKYYWVPLQNVRRLTIEAPADLRDAVWSPASFLWTNGGFSVALVPTRYPGSEGAADDAVRLARRTVFDDDEHGHATGLGQRLWATDTGEYAMLDTREIVLGGPLDREEIAAIANAEAGRPGGEAPGRGAGHG